MHAVEVAGSRKPFPARGLDRSEYHINCVRIDPAQGHDHRAVTHLGNRTENPGWLMDAQSVINMIERKSAKFYTVDWTTAKKIYLAVERIPGEPPCLRARDSHGIFNDALLGQSRKIEECRLL